MNKATLIGRFTKDPVTRYTSNNENSMCIARFTLAVDRRRNKNQDGPTADFISCVAFGKQGEFIGKNFHKGSKAGVVGRIQTGSYTKDGQTIYTTDVVVEEIEFGESKNSGNTVENGTIVDNGFVPVDEKDLPFADATSGELNF